MKKVLFAAIAMVALTSSLFAQNKEAQKKQETQMDTRTQQEVKTTANKAAGEGVSNEKFPQPKRIENSYPLTSDSARTKVTKVMQQMVVDLLSLFNENKEAHWNVNGPLYLPLHELYQEQADFYRTQADIFAERALQLGYSIDGRYSTISKTTNIPDFPGGYVTDNESIKLLLDRVTVLQKEVYNYIRETEDIDPVTSNKLQDLGYGVDKNIWKLRIHIQKPGSTGEDLPWSNQQSRDRTGSK
ncbi:MAG: DNA starvation/stationary phase protection protein [Bacteroidota bacterium]|nr:DNA starvation/stationary phase protection protein [Bacteroidota bacterium]